MPIQPGEGRRIVELQHLGKQMWCTSCKECLSFEYIENEQRRGLGSILYIRCHQCLLINIINTEKRHASDDSEGNKRFDINSKMALGKCIH